MPRSKMAGSYTIRQRSPALQPPIGLAVVIIVAAFLALLWLVPLRLFQPAVSLVALCLAAVAAMIALCGRTRHRGDGVDWWDIAGACAFIGSAAGMMTQPEQVLEIFGRPTAE